MLDNQDLIALAALAALLLYLKKKATDAAAAVTTAASDAAAYVWGGVDTGTSAVVYTVGDAVGIPRTDMTQCQKDIADGHLWDASFSCPAADFIKALAK